MKVEILEVLRDNHEGKDVEKTTFMGFEAFEINGYLVCISKTVFVVLHTDINRVSAIASCLKYVAAAGSESIEGQGKEIRKFLGSHFKPRKLKKKKRKKKSVFCRKIFL